MGLGLVKVNLRKERDKHQGKTGIRISFPFILQMVLLELLITKMSLASASHLPVTSDLNSDNSTKTTVFDEVNNKISFVKKEPHFNATCNETTMTISGFFAQKFKGRIYANDYSDEKECGVVLSNNPTESVTLTLTLGQCGIQMTAIDNNVDSVELLHEVSLYIQYSAFLQQMSDERVTVFCLQNSSRTEEPQEKQDSAGKSRQGRRMSDAARNPGGKPQNSRIGEAIMEIIGGKDPSPKSKKTSPVAVGEDVTLVISTKVLRGFDARVVNCTTHDGSRAASGSDGIRNQPILDSAGCSVDKTLVPNFRRRRLPVESRSRIITLHFASFQAFKFPDRDHLHMQCVVAYCQGPCPQESCDSNSNHYGSWRDKYGRIADVLVDTSQVVNSIEVLSPELDSHGGDRYDEKPQPRHAALGSQISVAANPENAGGNAGGGMNRPSQRQLLPAHYSKSPVAFQQFYPSDAFQNSRQQQMSLGVDYSVPPVNDLRQYNVCISPGTVIIALVVLGLIIVISITVTLWFALKRSEVRDYAESSAHSHKSPFSSPGPSPYYRFNHW